MTGSSHPSASLVSQLVFDLMEGGVGLDSADLGLDQNDSSNDFVVIGTKINFAGDCGGKKALSFTTSPNTKARIRARSFSNNLSCSVSHRLIL